ncbi:MAG: hypothetical protein NTV93_20555 [Verrucomicrobia bacterium]|nr:hypothetical protein [Verrucomicrobiota bacterium]
MNTQTDTDGENSPEVQSPEKTGSGEPATFELSTSLHSPTKSNSSNQNPPKPLPKVADLTSTQMDEMSDDEFMEVVLNDEKMLYEIRHMMLDMSLCEEEEESRSTNESLKPMPTAYELLGSGHSPAKPGSSKQNPPEPLTKEEEAEMLSLVKELVRGVTKKTPDELKGARLFMALDGKVGFAIYPTGEISSVFSHAAVGMEGIKLVGNVLRHIKANPVKGMWAASFNTRLVVLFTRFCGFKAVARVAFDPAEHSIRVASNPDCRDFEGGHPSTVIYRLDPQNAKPMDAAAVLAAFPETMPYADAVALAKAPVVESHTMQ